MCWCARTTVELIITYSKSGSPDSARNTHSHTPAFAHRLYRWNTLFQVPKLSGSSRQCAPVRAILEFQGADEISPAPGDLGLTPKASTSVTAVTPWTTDIDMLDGKRYIRWRWRFFVAEDFPAIPGIPGGPLPMPGVLDMTIPFFR